ncbi:LysR family transcriptional regulator [Sulfitobacter sp. D35]|uniref:LysR family transcriptional regulator n=1 Tax=Sulfitobacter sp. D35 TaxID=3083252 RepID=UPI00296F3437|nr:LysR family transcriptional regulator [Sulfitobacter sp. D35]MDW4499538.1 LysR family transcriptional regulator [Sulfitobacter sp. D35]
MNSVTLKQLDAFVQVADLGSFRRAAERLNTTQPNISARIAGLEATLGVTLMDRDAGSVRLTSRGRTLLDHARDVLRSVEAMLGAVGDAGLVQGVMRLGVTELVVHTWLSTYLGALRERFPNLLVELTVDLSADLSKALFDRSLDMTFQNGPFGRQISGTVELGLHPYVWVAGAVPDLGQGRRLAATDLLAHPILTHSRGTLAFDQISAHFAGTGVRPRLVPSSNLAACLQMALDGYGLACLPRAMVWDALATERLRELDYGWTPDPLGFAARFDAGRASGYVADAAELARDIALEDRNS